MKYVIVRRPNSCVEHVVIGDLLGKHETMIPEEKRKDVWGAAHVSFSVRGEHVWVNLFSGSTYFGTCAKPEDARPLALELFPLHSKFAVAMDGELKFLLENTTEGWVTKQPEKPEELPTPIPKRDLLNQQIKDQLRG